MWYSFPTASEKAGKVWSPVENRVWVVVFVMAADAAVD
jgi:hypothetical protein